MEEQSLHQGGPSSDDPEALNIRDDYKVLDDEFTSVSLRSTNPLVLEYKFDGQTHQEKLVNNLKVMQREGVFVDVTLKAPDGQSFQFHKVLLAAVSTSIRRLAAESQPSFLQESVPLRCGSSTILKALYEYIYTPQVPFDYRGNWDQLIAFAGIFGIEAMVNGIGELGEMFENVQSLYTQNELTFTPVPYGESATFCHKAVIAAASSVFRLLLEDPREDVLFLEGHEEKSVLKDLVDFIYTGKIDISEENVGILLKTACYYEFYGVAHACCNYLISVLDPSNSLTVLHFSRCIIPTYPLEFCNQLEQECKTYISENFVELVCSGFLDSSTSFEDIIDFLSRMNPNDLTQSSNIVEFVNRIMDWYTNNGNQNPNELIKIISYFHFNYMP